MRGYGHTMDFFFRDDDEDDVDSNTTLPTVEDNTEEHDIPELRRTNLGENDIIIARVSPDKMSDREYIQQLYALLAASFKEQHKAGKIRILPNDIELEIIEEDKPHPLY